MPVSMGKPPGSGSGWGCSCWASRNSGNPTPEQALAALARSANVTVTDLGWKDDGTRQFEAWTEPENRYIVTYDPNHAGSVCKHCIAALTAWAPWHRQLALGASDALDEIKRLRKELKARDREIAKLRG